MSDAMKHRHHDAEYEREDLTARSVFTFLIALLVMGALVAVFLKGMIWGLERYNRAHQPPQNPLVAKAPGKTGEVSPAEVGKFPNPRLETDEIHELRDFREGEEKNLYTYGWVDQNAGTVHIPIERAMELIVQRGLPTQVKTGTAPASTVEVAQKAAEKAETSAAKAKTKRKK